MAATTLRNIRMDDDLWHALGELAEAAGMDRSALVRAWIRAGIMPPPR